MRIVAHLANFAAVAVIWVSLITLITLYQCDIYLYLFIIYVVVFFLQYFLKNQPILFKDVLECREKAFYAQFLRKNECKDCHFPLRL